MSRPPLHRPGIFRSLSDSVANTAFIKKCQEHLKKVEEEEEYNCMFKTPKPKKRPKHIFVDSEIVERKSWDGGRIEGEGVVVSKRDLPYNMVRQMSH